MIYSVNLNANISGANVDFLFYKLEFGVLQCNNALKVKFKQNFFNESWEEYETAEDKHGSRV